MREIIDLTRQTYSGMPTFTAYWHPRVHIAKTASFEREGREVRSISFGTHTGTHVDAPRHFIRGGRSIDEVPLGRLVGKVSIVDFSHLGGGAKVTRRMLEKTKASERMLFKFGWEKHWEKEEFYADYPFFEKEAAEYLVSKGVGLIAMDTPSPDRNPMKMPKGEEDSPVHKVLLKSNVAIVECLANLGGIGGSGWSIAAIPLKIKGGDASPARVFLFR